MQRLALIVSAGLLLSACAGGGYYDNRDYRGGPVPAVVPSPGEQPPAHPLARSAVYECEDGSRVVVTEGQPAAMATLNSGMELRLARQPDVGGFRYGVPPYEFRGSGREGVLQSARAVFRCRVK
jgi:hypothetical protein